MNMRETHLLAAMLSLVALSVFATDASAMLPTRNHCDEMAPAGNTGTNRG